MKQYGLGTDRTSGVIESHQFTYSTLNFWRKLFILLQSVGAVVFVIAVVFAAKEAKEPGILIGWALLIVVLASWSYFAISYRKYRQIVALAFLNLLTLNLVGLLIMLSILRVTKIELDQTSLAEPTRSLEQVPEVLDGEAADEEGWFLTNQNYLGLLLFVIGVLALWLATDFAHVEFTGKLGVVIAPALMISLVCLLALTFTQLREKVSVFLVLGVVWMGAATYESISVYENGLKTKARAALVIGAMEDQLDGKPLTEVDSDGDPLAMVIQEFLQRSQDLRSEYEANVEDSKIVYSLEVDALFDVDKSRENLREIATLREKIPGFMARLKANVEQAAEEIRLIDKSTYRGFMKTKDDAVEQAALLYGYEDELLRLYEEIIGLCIRAKLKGQMTREEGQLLFYSDPMLNRFNELVNELQIVAEQQVGFQEQYSKNRRSQLEVLQNEFD